jgi:hypothetical protein
MDRLKFVEDTLVSVVSDRLPVLRSWRNVVPSKANRVKNFENWLQVETAHRLVNTDGVSAVRTNGCFHEPVCAHLLKGLRPHLSSDKAKRLAGKDKSQSVSPDLAVTFADATPAVEIEMKTQGSPQVILADLAVVEAVNRSLKDGTLSCFVWVVVAPEERLHADRLWESVGRIAKQAGLTMKPLDGEDWVRYCVAAPRRET